MTEAQLRQRAVEAMVSWLGAVPGSARHADILNTYNAHRPLARGYAIRPGDAYCAATVSAAWIRAGAAEIAPLEVSVPKMTELAERMGIWTEEDGFVPRPGDAVVYDWQDDGKGDNTGRPDHVGLVEQASGGVISVIEGNMGAGHLVGRRTLAVDGRYIRGFIRPDYASLCDEAGQGLPPSGAEAAPASSSQDLPPSGAEAAPASSSQGLPPSGGKVAAQQPDEGAREAAPSTAWVALPVLRRGVVGGHVKTLQILLNRYNGAGLAEDGVFGEKTLAAVKAYQTARALYPDGVAGVRTWTQLLK